MTDQIPDLWPADIQIKALSPVAILKAQAAQLRHRTKGLLEATVNTSTATDGDTLHEFVINALALNGYKYSLFRAWHKSDFIYPVTIEFREWVDAAQKEYDHQVYVSSPRELPRRQDGLRYAATPEELVEALAELLGSQQTRSVLMSLISRINELTPQPA